MTKKEKKLLDAVLKLQEHKNRIKNLLGARKPCARVYPRYDTFGEAVWDIPEPTPEMPDVYCSDNKAYWNEKTQERDVSRYCASCQHNEPLVHAARQLKRKTGGYANAVSRHADNILKEQRREVVVHVFKAALAPSWLDESTP